MQVHEYGFVKQKKKDAYCAKCFDLYCILVPFLEDPTLFVINKT